MVTTWSVSIKGYEWDQVFVDSWLYWKRVLLVVP